MGALSSSLKQYIFSRGQPKLVPVIAGPESADREPSQGSQPPPVAVATEVAGIASHSPIHPQLPPDHTDNTQVLMNTQPVFESLSPSYDGKQSRENQLFALIIGIDDYVTGPKLRGAVADAKAMKTYLKDALQVPENNILTLYDTQATRDAIIAAFKSLRNDQRIYVGDPIVIFYAGHGGELPAPQGWGPQSKIQCLLPQDYAITSAESDGTCTNIMPDRTVGALVENIAKEKGDNITVVFDCCHSASGTRDTNTNYTPRSVQLDVKIPADFDCDIWSSRAGSVPAGFGYHGFRSHVLLAACGEKEVAYEHEGHGQFTTKLLEILESCNVNDLTYDQLLKRIVLKEQNPHCEGINRHRVLFDGKARRRIHHTVQVQKGGKCTISAGLAHGISQGVEFTLYSDRNKSLCVVGIDETAVIGDFETTVTIPVHPMDVSFAKLTRVGKLPLCLAPGVDPSVINGANDQQFKMVGIDEAKLEMGMVHGEAVFKILDPQVKDFGLEVLPYNAPLNTLDQVLASAAHFYWFLGKTNKYHGIGVTDEVTVGFYSLKEGYDDYGLPLLSPIEPGFCKQDPKSDKSYVIDFVIDPKALYGIKITNNTQMDLFLNVFLFNTSSLSVAPCYTQSSAGNPEAPLKHQGTFTIGYGSGGAPPFSYSLEETQKVDVGHLKIFFATQPFDLSDIGHASPFESELTARDFMDDSARGARLSTKQPKSTETEHTWFTLDIPVVQRRG